MDEDDHVEHDGGSSDDACDTETVSTEDASDEDTNGSDRDYSHIVEDEEEDPEDDDYSPPVKHGRARGALTQADALLLAISEIVHETGRESLPNRALLEHDVACSILEIGQYAQKAQCVKKGYLDKSDAGDVTITAKGWCATMLACACVFCVWICAMPVARVCRWRVYIRHMP